MDSIYGFFSRFESMSRGKSRTNRASSCIENFSDPCVRNNCESPQTDMITIQKGNKDDVNRRDVSVALHQK